MEGSSCPMYSLMLTLFLIRSKNGKSSQFWNGSVQVTPLVLHQCVNGAVFLPADRRPRASAGGLRTAPAALIDANAPTISAATVIPTILLMKRTLQSGAVPRAAEFSSRAFE